VHDKARGIILKHEVVLAVALLTVLPLDVGVEMEILHKAVTPITDSSFAYRWLPRMHWMFTLNTVCCYGNSIEGKPYLLTVGTCTHQSSSDDCEYGGGWWGCVCEDSVWNVPHSLVLILISNYCHSLFYLMPTLSHLHPHLLIVKCISSSRIVPVHSQSARWRQTASESWWPYEALLPGQRRWNLWWQWLLIPVTSVGRSRTSRLVITFVNLYC